MANIPEIDWQLHAPMVYKILTDSKYLERKGISFHLNDKTFTIHRIGGWSYSPCRIRSFEAALSVLRDNGGACSPHFSAICLLEGVSYHKILDSGRNLLKRIYNEDSRMV